MSGKAKAAVFVWTLMVVVGTFLILHPRLKTRRYRGNEVSFTTDSDWYVDIHTVKPARIEAADSEYFRIVQEETHLHGIPTSPPLDYTSEYFYLEAGMQRGKWKIVHGSSVSIKLISEGPFEVVHSPSSDVIVAEIGVGALLGFLLWLIILLMAPGFTNY